MFYTYSYAKHGIDPKEIPPALLPYVRKDVIDDPLDGACLYYHRSIDLIPFFQQILPIVSPNTKVISVGSGCGEEEQRLADELGDAIDDVICVDPDPQSYSREQVAAEVFGSNAKVKDIVKSPKYSTIQDLLKDPEDQKLVQKSILLLDWTYGKYDYQALQLLQPLVVVVRYEMRSFRRSAASVDLAEDFMGHFIDHKCIDANFSDVLNRDESLTVAQSAEDGDNKGLSTAYHLYQSARLPFDAFWLEGEVLRNEDSGTLVTEPIES